MRPRITGLRAATATATATILFAILGGSHTQAAQRPNVIVILADDQGWGDLSVHGNTNLATPHIDSLARDGARFEQFFVCPVCSPTRAEYLTGRYHPRGGVWSTSTGGERLNLDERTIADAFQAAGYATGAFGKWHNGTQWPYHPTARGFDEFYGFCSGHWGHYFDPILERNGQTVRGRGFIADDFTDQALAFIEQNRARPFFCYLPFNTPHSPMQVPERFFDKFRAAPLALRATKGEAEEPDMTRAALALCENIDWNVGRILQRLDQLQLADQTIVVYFSDNGPNSWRWNGGLKGRKASTDEGGVRSPLLIRWPGKVAPGSRISELSAAIDLLPTLCELAGVPRAGDKPLDGESLAAALLGQPHPPLDRMIFSHWAGKVSVRTAQFRLDQNGQLFDMQADVGQTQAVNERQPDAARRLQQAADAWRTDVLGPLRRDAADTRPLTVGYREFPAAPLPARDGVAHGNIERSARAPNCSYFTHWTSTDDAITWNIEVHTPGTYQATLHYTCAEADVGSTVELSFAGRRVQARIAKAWDPPLVGAEQDRVPRVGESLVKDFAPLELGQFELPATAGPLTLCALDVAGKQVADVRGVVLTLVE